MECTLWCAAMHSIGVDSGQTQLIRMQLIGVTWPLANDKHVRDDHWTVMSTATNGTMRKLPLIDRARVPHHHYKQVPVFIATPFLVTSRWLCVEVERSFG